MEQGKKFYDVWMFESNDDIQALATAFGERFFLESAWKLYETCQFQGAKDLLAKVLRLHMVDLIKEDLPFYLTHDLVTHSFAKQIVEEFDKAVYELVPHINDVIEAMGQHKVEAIHPPMSRDWTKFNE